MNVINEAIAIARQTVYRHEQGEEVDAEKLTLARGLLLMLNARLVNME